MRLTPALLLASSVVFADPVAAPTLTDAEQKKLLAGEIVTRSTTPTDNKGVGAMAIGVVEGPTDEVFPVVRDCQHFWQFMPRTKKSWVKEEQGVGTICHVELTMPFPLPDLWSDSISIVKEEPKGHHYRGWTMVRGTYHRNDGYWTVVPWGDGSKSLVVYSIDSDPKMAVPDALIRVGQAGSLPEVIGQIRKRVAKLRSDSLAAAGSR
jgi:ribosome-associated toxin RatA of RatAB toxin-antitoxin module